MNVFVTFIILSPGDRREYDGVERKANMSILLDLDDVVAGNPLAVEELAQLLTELHQMTETSNRRKIVNERLKAENEKLRNILVLSKHGGPVPLFQMQNETDQLRARCEKMEAALRGLQIDNDNTFMASSGMEIDTNYCSLCGTEEEYHPREKILYSVAHKPDCPVLAARAVLEEK